MLCAGVVCAKRRTTGDGWEETLQVNALAQALLLDLVWPKLVAKPGRKSRVLVITSALHIGAAKRGLFLPATMSNIF